MARPLRSVLLAAALAGSSALAASCTNGPTAAAYPAATSSGTATAAPAATPSATPVGSPAATPEAAHGIPAEVAAEQEQARELHRRLTWAGLYSGPVGDAESEQTAAAVRRFQRKFGLTGDGKPGGRTWARLRGVTKDGDGVPARCRTSGKVICIDKSLKLVRALQGGQVVQVLDARFGRRSLPTANGTFRVQWRSRYHHIRKYDAPMPYALFFYGGKSVHFSPEFARVGYQGGSHGCVNLRDKPGAARLFDWAPTGTTVVVYSS